MEDYMMEPTLRSARLRGVKSMADQVRSWAEDVANPKRRVPLGWHRLDDLVRGPAPGEVFTVVASSHVGKSLFATNVMANNPESHIIFFSLEMPEAQVLHNLAAHVFSIPSDDLETAEYQRVLPELVHELPSRLPFHAVVDESNLGLEDMSVYLEDYATRYGERPALAIIDYLEEVGGGKASGEGYLRAEATASAMKAWAKQERIGVLLLHQLKMNEKQYEPPTKQSVKSAGYTEADVMIGLWRPGWDPGLTDIGARKERDNWLGVNVIKNRVRGRLHEGLEFRIDPALRIVPAPNPIYMNAMDFYDRSS